MRTNLLAALLAAIATAGLVAGTVTAGGPVLSQAAFIAVGLILPVLGRLLAARRPDLPYGWLLLAAAVCFGVGVCGAGLTRVAPGLAAAALVAMVAFYGLSWVYIPLLFPEGRLPSRRWRPVAWLAGIAITLHATGNLLVPFLPGRPFEVNGPVQWAGVFASAAGQFTVWVLGYAVLGGLVLRLRRSEPPERAQYGWMVAGATANQAGIVLGYLFLAGQQGQAVGVIGMVAVLGALPGAIVVAVARHRLLDIRIGLRGSRLLLVFDVRPTVGEVLSSLAPKLEDSPEPVEQLGRLATAVRTGLETRWAAVTLADGRRVVSGAEDGPAALTLPVRGGQGSLECGPRVSGRLSREDRRFLEALAVPAGLAIQSAGLATRLVNAQEAERRRIERNIHDGVQQQLVALIAGIELARATGGGAGTLGHLREQARQTLADLRELAAGIHPSALGQGGLVNAVEERCARLPVPVQVFAGRELRAERFPDEIEGAMYFTVSEAVANALKHAAAARIEVRLARDVGRLGVTVSDDGRGFEVRPGVLGTLTDRLTALGGGLRVESERGKGTRVDAWVPVDG
ncbi:sensor histidine kinase [Nonomuraea sp. SBT364]|uniref:sensor histidine kinase n=1 Tax=Nonomuraea sp. SBT364 TaxID=1580530 RepID=UPI00066C8F81|nr:histidine kinase [Nonomuraea sp. SBT364]